MKILNQLPEDFDSSEVLCYVLADKNGTPLPFPAGDVNEIIVFQHAEYVQRIDEILFEQSCHSYADLSEATLSLRTQSDIEAYIWESSINVISIYVEDASNNNDPMWLSFPKANFGAPKITR